MKKSIILIGGAPTTGKSTMARLLSERLTLPWISTDQIRELARSAAPRHKRLKIFNPQGYTAERFLKTFSAKEIVKMEMDQGKEIWPMVRAFIRDPYPWDEGFIMEGVSILPHLVAKDFKERKDIKAVFLVDEDADRTRQVVYTRGLWGHADSYSDTVKEKEVEWAQLFSHRLKVEVQKHGYPWVEVKKGEEDVKRVLRALQIRG